MQESLKTLNDQFIDEIRQSDDVIQFVLKGHLIMEGTLTEAIQTYLLHGDFIDDARLQMSQKIAICRAISTSNQHHKMWRLIGQINTLRNALAHSLDPDRRAQAITKLRVFYEEEFGDLPDATKGIPNGIEKDFPADSALCLYAIGGALGFLNGHLEEVKRLKSLIAELDAAVNGGALQQSGKAATSPKSENMSIRSERDGSPPKT